MPKHELPHLPFNYNALEPYIDRTTMELHYSKHHNTYVMNLNKALEEIKEVNTSLEELFKNISKYPAAVRNNGGGHYNHSLFWAALKPNGENKPKGALLDALISNFGTFDDFKLKFTDAAASVFGSGWAWLIMDHNVMHITSTPNQDNPLMDIAPVKGSPILNLDVWEHAYYLQYKYRRTEYIANWWNIVNWDEVARRYALYDTMDPYQAFQRQ